MNEHDGSLDGFLLGALFLAFAKAFGSVHFHCHILPPVLCVLPGNHYLTAQTAGKLIARFVGLYEFKEIAYVAVVRVFPFAYIIKQFFRFVICKTVIIFVG